MADQLLASLESMGQLLLAMDTGVGLVLLLRRAFDHRHLDR